MGGRVAAATVLWLALSGAAIAECAPDRAELTGPFGAATFTVEIADDAAERARGLMFVESMGTFEGMLFVYERPQPVAFWMENTLIPLDMIFMDETGTVRKVHANAIPGDRTAIPGGDDILLVLEINGGLAARLGIEPGAVLRHPSVPQDRAARPC